MGEELSKRLYLGFCYNFGGHKTHKVILQFNVERKYQVYLFKILLMKLLNFLFKSRKLKFQSRFLDQTSHNSVNDRFHYVAKRKPVLPIISALIGVEIV